MTTQQEQVTAIVRALRDENCRNVWDTACQLIERQGIFPGADDPNLTNYDQRIQDAVLAACRDLDRELPDLDDDELADYLSQQYAESAVDLVARGRALVASSLSGHPETPDPDEAREAIFQALLIDHPDWELFDCGSVPETGLRCKHCGKEEVFSDRDVAIAALNGAILCSNCEGEPDDTYADPNTLISRKTERGAMLYGYALSYYGENLLELVTHSAVGTVTAALLTHDDAIALRDALTRWIDSNRLVSDTDHAGE